MSLSLFLRHDPGVAASTCEAQGLFLAPVDSVQDLDNLEATGLFSVAVLVDARQPNSPTEPTCNDDPATSSCFTGVNFVKVTDGSSINLNIFDR